MGTDATSVITPMIAGLHWLDLDQEFELKVTFQIKTPLGTFKPEYRLRFSDLASALAAITNIWTGASPAVLNRQLAFTPGDPATLTDAAAALSAIPGTAIVLPTIPPGYVDETGWTGPAVPYDGVADSWGATGP